MVSDQVSDGSPKWTWGETVRVLAGAPVGLRPGALGEIGGIRSVETAEQSTEFGTPIGSTLYSIEFGDGVSAEMPATWLERIDGQD